MACVKPYPDFDANTDAQTLYAAMKGAGTDEDVIIDVLAHRCVDQRKEIEKAFKALYGEDLKEKLKSELRGDFELLTLWCFLNRAELNAAALHKAMEGGGTDEDMLVSVICTASCDKMNEIKAAYQEMYGKSLEDAIESECHGDFKRVLIAVLQGGRQKGVDGAQAKIDAQTLFDAGEGRMGTDESTFNRLICNCSFKQIELIDQSYIELTGHSLLDAIKKEASGDYEKALMTIVKYAKDKWAAIAEILYKSMKGAGTRDDSLIRCILAYAESGLKLIKIYFDGHYEKSLAEMIEGDTSGDYKKFLLAILN